MSAPKFIDFANHALALFFLVFTFCLGCLSGYVVRPLVESVQGELADGQKAPITFFATLRQANSTYRITGWVSAEWNEKRESWRISSVSTVQPDGREIMTQRNVVDEGLIASNKYLRVYDGSGRFIGWFEIISDQGGSGVDVPVGSKPTGQAPSGSVGKAPPQAPRRRVGVAH